MNRTFVTIHLPISMNAAGKVLKAVGQAYPDATVGYRRGNIVVLADADETLSMADRRRIARERSKKARSMPVDGDPVVRRVRQHALPISEAR